MMQISKRKYDPQQDKGALTKFHCILESSVSHLRHPVLVVHIDVADVQPPRLFARHLVDHGSQRLAQLALFRVEQHQRRMPGEMYKKMSAFKVVFCGFDIYKVGQGPKGERRNSAGSTWADSKGACGQSKRCSNVE
jgi:hypothetical protein